MYRILAIFATEPLFATLALVLWGFVTQVMRYLIITLDGIGWALLVILSLGPMLFDYLLFTVSPRYLSASIASLFHILEPVMTALLAFFSPGPHPDRPSVARLGPDGASPDGHAVPHAAEKKKNASCP